MGYQGEDHLTLKELDDLNSVPKTIADLYYTFRATNTKNAIYNLRKVVIHLSVE